MRSRRGPCAVPRRRRRGTPSRSHVWPRTGRDPPRVWLPWSHCTKDPPPRSGSERLVLTPRRAPRAPGTGGGVHPGRSSRPSGFHPGHRLVNDPHRPSAPWGEAQERPATVLGGRASRQVPGGHQDVDQLAHGLLGDAHPGDQVAAAEARLGLGQRAERPDALLGEVAEAGALERPGDRAPVAAHGAAQEPVECLGVVRRGQAPVGPRRAAGRGHAATLGQVHSRSSLLTFIGGLAGCCHDDTLRTARSARGGGTVGDSSPCWPAACRWLVAWSR